MWDLWRLLTSLWDKPRRTETVLVTVEGSDAGMEFFLGRRTLHDVAQRFVQDPKTQRITLLMPSGSYLTVGLDEQLSTLNRDNLLHKDGNGNRYLVVQAGTEPSYRNITFFFADELGNLDKFKFAREVTRSKMITALQNRGLFAICGNADEAYQDEDAVMDLRAFDDVEFEDGATYFAQLKGPSQPFGDFIRSVVDADEHRMSKRMLRKIHKQNPNARRICQKQFWSIDKTIKVEIDVLIEDGDVLYIGEGKTRLGYDALVDLNKAMTKIKQMEALDGNRGDASFFYGKTLIPFLFGRTWVSSGISKEDNNRQRWEADLNALVQNAAAQGVLVLFPGTEDLGCSQACFPGHQLSVPVTARNVCASSSASKQAPAAIAMRRPGPPRALRVQVRQQPVPLRMLPAHGLKPRGCRIVCSGIS